MTVDYERGYPPGVPMRFRRRIEPDGSPWSQKRTQLAERIRDSRESLILLHGDRGTGKTQLAADLCWFQIQIGGTAQYTTAAEMFRRIRESFRDEGEGEVACIRRFSSPRLLVIDEAHERGHTDFEDRVLVSIIDRRYGDLKHTVLVTNEKPEQARVSLGPSVWSRMSETGGLVHANWQNYRVQAKERGAA